MVIPVCTRLMVTVILPVTAYQRHTSHQRQYWFDPNPVQQMPRQPADGHEQKSTQEPAQDLSVIMTAPRGIKDGRDDENQKERMNPVVVPTQCRPDRQKSHQYREKETVNGTNYGDSDPDSVPE